MGDCSDQEIDRRQKAAEMIGKRTVNRFIFLNPLRRFLSRRLWLVLLAVHFDRPEQMGEGELGELPVAVFLDIDLSHHERIGDFAPTDYRLQVDVLQQDGSVTEYASVDCVNYGFLVPDTTAFDGGQFLCFSPGSQ